MISEVSHKHMSDMYNRIHNDTNDNKHNGDTSNCDKNITSTCNGAGKEDIKRQGDDLHSVYVYACVYPPAFALRQIYDS